MYVEFEYWEVVGYRFEYSDMKMILHRPSMDVDGWMWMDGCGWMNGWMRMIDDEYWGKETKKPHHNHNPTLFYLLLCYVSKEDVYIAITENVTDK